MCVKSVGLPLHRTSRPTVIDVEFVLFAETLATLTTQMESLFATAMDPL